MSICSEDKSCPGSCVLVDKSLHKVPASTNIHVQFAEVVCGVPRPLSRNSGVRGAILTLQSTRICA
ncbi:hypothetical protein IF1G_08144 [Cordyceps javanica]|uniref:Uncharacterized protein n=1 Tax=Cordyceps javanica TaxID=43265 RepID=A0A545UVU0_9HYPO|nr:hypothetical protein IF1G_08144 [Cordyceps javanica]